LQIRNERAEELKRNRKRKLGSSSSSSSSSSSKKESEPKGKKAKTGKDKEVVAPATDKDGKDTAADAQNRITPEVPVDLKMPTVNATYLTAFVRAFQRENCAEKVFNMAVKIARYLAEVEENKIALLKEIGQTTRNLTKEIDLSLKDYIGGMSTSPSDADYALMKFGGSLYKLHGRQARLLRLVNFLDSMGLLQPAEESKEEAKKDDEAKADATSEGKEGRGTRKRGKREKRMDVESSSSSTRSAATGGARLGRLMPEVAMIVPSMQVLWNTLDTYLLKLVPPKTQDEKTSAPLRNGKKNAPHGTKRSADGKALPSSPNRVGGGGKLERKFKQSPTTPKTRSSLRRRKSLEGSAARGKSTPSSSAKATKSSSSSSLATVERVDIEEDDADISQLLQLQPLIECYFVVNSPKTQEAMKSERFREFREFTHAHRKILNIFCQKKPSLMKRSMKSLLWHPKKILNFHNKHIHFLSEIRKQRQQYGHLPSLRVLVRRKRFFFEDSYHQIKDRSVQELKRPVTVKFYGEAGVDAGGLTREWFLLLSREIFNPGYCLFTPAADNANVFQPNPNSYVNPDHLDYFKFVGRFVGKAIYDQQLLDAYFTRSFYKHMLGMKPSLSDIESIDPAYYKSLKWISQNNIDGQGLCMTFTLEDTVFGKQVVYELKKDGKDIEVTDANKEEYLQLIAEKKLTKSIQGQIDAFLKGFREIIDPKLLSIFNEQELELLICGLPDIDVNDLKANTEYKGIPSSSQLIQWFWEVVDDMTQEEKANLVQFVTGTSKVPINGFKSLQGMNGTQRFQIHKASGKDRLPTAHTCFNQLDLPDYSSLKSMRKNILLAIREGAEGFAFR